MSLFLDYRRGFCKPTTVKNERALLRHFYDYLVFTFNSKTIHKRHLTQLSKNHLCNYIIYINQRKIAPYSKVNYFLVVKKYLTWEAEQGTIKEDLLNILDRSRLPKVPDYLPRPLSSENDRYLQTILRQSDDPYANLFLLLRLTGLRISELINLPRHCIITNSKNEPFLKVPLGKMNNERLLPLNEEAMRLIDKIKSSYPIRKNQCDPNRLIGMKGSVAHIYQYLDLHFKKLLNGLTDQDKPITFHRLRHTYATSLLAAGVGIVSIMKLLGHRRIEMSLRYTKVTPVHLRNEYLKAMALLDETWHAKQHPLLKTISSEFDPPQIIAQLKAFADKATLLNPKQKKNLILRLSRLQEDLTNITFSQKFNLDPTA